MVFILGGAGGRLNLICKHISTKGFRFYFFSKSIFPTLIVISYQGINIPSPSFGNQIIKGNSTEKIKLCIGLK